MLGDFIKTYLAGADAAPAAEAVPVSAATVVPASEDAQVRYEALFQHFWVDRMISGPERAALTFKVAFDGDGDLLAVYLYDVRFYAFASTPASRIPAIICDAVKELGALPDVDSEIIFQWGARVTYKDRSGTLSAAASILLQLASLGTNGGSLSLAWNDGTARTASDNGAGGLTGAGTGTVSYATSLVTLRPTVLPASSVAITATYDHGDPVEETFTAPAREVECTRPLDSLARIPNSSASGRPRRSNSGHIRCRMTW